MFTIGKWTIHHGRRPLRFVFGIEYDTDQLMIDLPFYYATISSTQLPAQNQQRPDPQPDAQPHQNKDSGVVGGNSPPGEPSGP